MIRRSTPLPYLAGGFAAGTLAALFALAPAARPWARVEAADAGAVPQRERARPLDAAALPTTGDPVHPWRIEETLVELSRGERRPLATGETLASPDGELPGASPEPKPVAGPDAAPANERLARALGEIEGPEGDAASGPWVVLDPLGEPAAAGAFRGGLPEGRWTFWHPDGALHLEGGFEQGLASGPWRGFDEQGRASFETAYLEGEEHGARTQWFPSGEPALYGQHDHGLRTGEWITFHEDGTVRSRGSYQRGVRDGTWNQWYENGEPRMQGTYAEGRRHGPWVSWYASGVVEERGGFLAGRREGRWEFAFADGSPDPRTGTYRAGRRIDG